MRALICVFSGLLLCSGMVLANEERRDNPDFVQIATIALESRGEPIEGQIAVGEVIRNRAFRRVVEKTFTIYSDPPAIEDFWRSLYVKECLRWAQFSCWNERDKAEITINKMTDQEWQTASEAWVRSQEHKYADGATHYHSIKIKPYWARSMRFIKRIGNHDFYEEI